MPLSAVSIKGYRSIRTLYLPVDACSIFIGANGVGKTNLYKALGLFELARRVFVNEWGETQAEIEKEIKRREAL